MILVRQIDYSLQILIGLLMILSFPILFCYGVFAGLFLLGCWQLLSAAFNTYAYMTNGFGKQILTYWKLAVLVIGVLLFSVFCEKFLVPDVTLVLSWLAITGSIPVAIYYLYIYNNMIAHMRRKRELGGLTKSKR